MQNPFENFDEIDKNRNSDNLVNTNNNDTISISSSEEIDLSELSGVIDISDSGSSNVTIDISGDFNGGGIIDISDALNQDVEIDIEDCKKL